MSSKINSRAHAERVTRQAAAAIGLHVPDTARWDELLGGLQLAPATLYAKNTFAPLNDPADAYKIEVALKINVFHSRRDDGSYVLSLRSSEDAAAGAIMQTVNPGDDATRLRMEAVVLFGALHAIMAMEV